MSNTFNTGDIIQHETYSDDDDKYFYIVLNRFNRYTIEYYNLFCLLQGKEVTLRMDNQKHYKGIKCLILFKVCGTYRFIHPTYTNHYSIIQGTL